MDWPACIDIKVKQHCSLVQLILIDTQELLSHSKTSAIDWYSKNYQDSVLKMMLILVSGNNGLGFGPALLNVNIASMINIPYLIDQTSLPLKMKLTVHIQFDIQF